MRGPRSVDAPSTGTTSSIKKTKPTAWPLALLALVGCTPSAPAAQEPATIVEAPRHADEPTHDAPADSGAPATAASPQLHRRRHARFHTQNSDELRHRARRRTAPVHQRGVRQARTRAPHLRCREQTRGQRARRVRGWYGSLARRPRRAAWARYRQRRPLRRERRGQPRRQPRRVGRRARQATHTNEARETRPYAPRDLLATSTA